MILLTDQEASAKARQLIRFYKPNRERLAESLGVDPKTSRQNKTKALYRMLDRIENAHVLRILRDLARYFELPETTLIFPESMTKTLVEQFPHLMVTNGSHLPPCNACGKAMAKKTLKR